MSFVNAVQKRNTKKKYAKKPKSLVTVDDVFLMTELFQRKTWNQYDGYECVLQAYVDVLGRMKDPEKDLFLDLTERFLWIMNYRADIVKQLNRILSQFNYNNYYVIRCIEKEEQKKSKSSGVVLYEIKNPVIQKQLVKPVTLLYSTSDLRKLKDLSNSLFILVDDFVGTGKTATDCMDDLKEVQPTIDGKMVVMCIAALERGIATLSNLNVPVFFSYKLNRGISDYYTGYKLKQNTLLMHQIESSFKIPNNHFGFEESEALVCLKRCPNNTFPIYWHGRKTPYPRY